MLVLSRKDDQSIVIGENIEITVLAIEGNSVKLGISAPEDVKVLRGELWTAIIEQQELARRLADQDEEPQTFSQLRELLVEEQTVSSQP